VTNGFWTRQTTERIQEGDWAIPGNIRIRQKGANEVKSGKRNANSGKLLVFGEAKEKDR